MTAPRAKWALFCFATIDINFATRKTNVGTPAVLLEPLQEVEPVWKIFRPISDKICSVASAFN